MPQPEVNPVEIFWDEPWLRDIPDVFQMDACALGGSGAAAAAGGGNCYVGSTAGGDTDLAWGDLLIEPGLFGADGSDFYAINCYTSNDVGNDYHFVDGSEIFTMMSPAFHMTGVSSYNSSEQLHGMQPAQRGSGGGAFRFNSGGSGHQQPFAFNGPPAIQHAEDGFLLGQPIDGSQQHDGSGAYQQQQMGGGAPFVKQAQQPEDAFMTVQQHFSYPNAGGPQQQPHGHASRRTSTRRGPPGGGAQSVYARAYPATAGIAAGGGRLIAGAVPPHRQRMMATESARAAGGSPPAQRGSGGSSPRTPRGGGAAGRGRFVPSGPAAGDSSSPVGRQQSGAAGEMIDDMMLSDESLAAAAVEAVRSAERDGSLFEAPLGMLVGEKAAAATTASAGGAMTPRTVMRGAGLFGGPGGAPPQPPPYFFHQPSQGDAGSIQQQASFCGEAAAGGAELQQRSQEGLARSPSQQECGPQKMECDGDAGGGQHQLQNAGGSEQQDPAGGGGPEQQNAAHNAWSAWAAAGGGCEAAEENGESPAPTPRGRSGAQAARKRSSRFRGVTKHRRSGRWEAHIWVRETGKQVYLGGYELEEHAAEAYDVAALKCKGIKVKTNFPVQKYMELMSYLDTVSLDELVMAVRRQSQGFARGTSTYRGVTHHPNGRWEARLGVPGSKHVYLGLFNEETAAARAYDRALVRLRGPNASTNFALSDYEEELAAYEENASAAIAAGRLPPGAAPGGGALGSARGFGGGGGSGAAALFGGVAPAAGAGRGSFGGMQQDQEPLLVLPHHGQRLQHSLYRQQPLFGAEQAAASAAQQQQQQFFHGHGQQQQQLQAIPEEHAAEAAAGSGAADGGASQAAAVQGPAGGLVNEFNSGDTAFRAGFANGGPLQVGAHGGSSSLSPTATSNLHLPGGAARQQQQAQPSAAALLAGCFGGSSDPAAAAAAGGAPPFEMEHNIRPSAALFFNDNGAFDPRQFFSPTPPPLLPPLHASFPPGQGLLSSGLLHSVPADMTDTAMRGAGGAGEGDGQPAKGGHEPCAEAPAASSDQDLLKAAGSSDEQQTPTSGVVPTTPAQRKEEVAVPSSPADAAASQLPLLPPASMARLPAPAAAERAAPQLQLPSTADRISMLDVLGRVPPRGPAVAALVLGTTTPGAGGALAEGVTATAGGGQ